MSYAIEILEKDKNILEKCLSEWESTKYPEAKKERQLKLDSLNKAINLLKGI